MSRSCTWHANVCTWRRLVMFTEQFDPALQFLTTVQSRPRHAMPWFDSVMMKYWMYRKGLPVWGRRRPARLSRCWCGYRISTRVYRISITQPIRRRCPRAAISNLLPRWTSLSRMNNNKGVADNKMLTLQVFVKQTKNSHQYYLILIFHNKSCEPRQRQRRYIFTLLTFECCWTAERV